MNVQENNKMFLLDHLLEVCRKNKEKELFRFESKEESVVLTGEDLQTKILIRGSQLKSRILPSQRAILCLPQGSEYLLTFLSCLYANIVVVPTPIPELSSPKLIIDKLQSVLSDSGATTILTIGAFKAHFALEDAFPNCHIICVDKLGYSAVDILVGEAIQGDDLAVLLYTSGSVSVPKGVMITHTNLLTQAKNGAEQWEMNNKSIVVSWMPQFHNFGLFFNLLAPLLQEATSVVLSPASFLKKPEMWLSKLHEHQATHTAAPNFAFDYLCSNVDIRSLTSFSLHSITNIVCGGEPIRKQTYENFVGKFEVLGLRKDVFCPHYGLSEIGSVTTWKSGAVPHFLLLDRSAFIQNEIKIIDDEQDGKAVVSCGQLFEKNQVRIVNPNSLIPCKDGEMGEVWVKSSAVAAGYFDLLKNNDIRFLSTLNTSGEEGFFRTGDLGFVDHDNLFILGRIKEIIIVNGKNYHPVDIECCIRSNFPKLTLPLTVFSEEVDTYERIHIVQEINGVLSEEEYLKDSISMAEVVSENLGLPVYAINWVQPGSIPKTSSGKIKRIDCKKLYITGNLSLDYQYIQSREGRLRDPTLSQNIEEESVFSFLKHEIFTDNLGSSKEAMSDEYMLSIAGFNSIDYVRFAGKIEEKFQMDFSPSLFYKYRNIHELAAYIMTLVSGVSASHKPVEENIDYSTSQKGNVAIIGMSFNFPNEVSNEDQLWDILMNGKSTLSDIPRDRDEFYKGIGKDESFPKFGGFLNNISHFDANFFGITPLEAECMDPQQRKTLELTWNVIENAGYNPKDLAGKSVGVFIGVHNNDYAEIISSNPKLSNVYGGYLDSGLHVSMIANRVSNWFDFQGPSESINTACSSSLVALHHAIAAMERGECKIAIAGGINLILSPRVHIASYKAGMLAPDGLCKTFDETANGFVRSEGFGAVMLKPLANAIADQDTIYGVVKGVAINHGGRSNSLRAPNLNAQKQLIKNAYQQSGIPLETIGYIETHGTGTALGDPIEVQALKEAFNEINPQLRPYTCGLGTIKTNIGHCESAAGIAGFIKVLLSMQYKKLPGILHFKKINPFINLEESPFYVVDENQEWKTKRDIDGKELPRRAGISSFGFGGTNVHLIVEEYLQTNFQPTKPISGVLVPLSARTPEALYRLAEQLCRFLARHQEDDQLFIQDIAYTLQVGREAFLTRIAFVVKSKEDLLIQLKEYIRTNNLIDKSLITKVNKLGGIIDDEDFRVLYAKWKKEGRTDKLANFWINGGSINWRDFYLNGECRRIPLPGYSFAEEHFWVQEEFNSLSQIGINDSPTSFHHPLLHTNTSNLNEQSFSSSFTGTEFFFSDHQINGKAILPAAAYLEMIHAAILSAQVEEENQNKVVVIKNIYWMDPLMATNQGCQLHIVLQQSQDKTIVFDIYSLNDANEIENIYAQGTALLENKTDSLGCTISELCNAYQSNEIDAEQYYAYFKTKGIEYGPSFRCINKMYVCQERVLAELVLPNSLLNTLHQYTIHPSILDAALHASIGLMDLDEGDKLKIPFSLDEAVLLQRCQQRMFAHVKKIKEDEKSLYVDIDLLDENGLLCVQLKKLMLRSISGQLFQESQNQENELLLFAADWKAQSLVTPVATKTYTRKIAILCEPESDMFRELEGLADNQDLLVLNFGGESLENRYIAYSEELIIYIQKMIKAGVNGDVLFQLVVSNKKEKQLFKALGALLKTACIENPSFYVQTLLVDDFKTICEQVSNHPKPIITEDIVGQNVVCEWNKLDVKRNNLIPWKEDGVYLITGGIGNLGKLTAQEITKTAPLATIILTGRSDEKFAEEKLSAYWNTDDMRIFYRKSEITTEDGAQNLINGIIDDFGKLNGVIHTAGIKRDNFILKKSAEEVREVLEPKVSGLFYLDGATKLLNLDFFICFSSIAGSFGNIGQADYAAANAFMDEYMHYRNQLVLVNQRFGHSLSINWPLWKDGGMTLDAHAQQSVWETMGMAPMTSSNGFSALYQCMENKQEQVLVIEGTKKRILDYISKINHQDRFYSLSKDNIETEMLNLDFQDDKRLAELKRIVASVTRLSVDRIDVDAPMDKYGIDSVMIIELTVQLEKIFGPLSKTLFFEHQNLRSLNHYLRKKNPRYWSESPQQKYNAIQTPINNGRSLSLLTKQKATPNQTQTVSNEKSELNSSSKDSIAVIGLSGKYANSDNIIELWNNLKSGNNCITEVPEDRWDWKANYSTQRGKKGSIYTKWGGFIKDIDKFDPLFFRVSPVDAEKMDPQERLFIEQSYVAIEDAGYTTTNVSKNRKVGVFVGVMHGLYSTEPRYWSIANRVSYLFNFHGPSMAVDTACSSSLTAIHLAMESLRSGESECAIAGGVNLIVDQKHFVGLSEMTMVSSSNQCRSFGEHADGFVDAEGVGVVLLKPLQKAIADKDHIYGVLKASSINSGGKTNGYTVPNPVLQAELVANTLEKANIDARSISYVEAHGTGTALGDPLEIAGLTRAFEKDTLERQYCAIGSVKSNIGHCESAAGIAGLTKVLLQMKYKQLVPSLHAETLNPNIDFSNSPFRVQRNLERWEQARLEINGQETTIPRRAALSSFGAGGANAHLIIEEYVPNSDDSNSDEWISPYAILLSAKDADRLDELVVQFLLAVDEQEFNELRLPAVAYTLQTGREHMEERLAFVASSFEELKETLVCFLGNEPSKLFHGNIRTKKDTLIESQVDERTDKQNIDQLIETRNYSKLCELWVEGLEIDWSQLYTNHKPVKVSLPTYPFAQNRYWAHSQIGMFEIE
ncbi:SDR family NAD(P)-dependent oxidoreductase [Chryseobacterium sp. c4a]|uniref:SDR family NAD(P)-dependent oxidoreductase n=1 Tax=Chryseobacterium sp. c4a TaxID=1573582 RepID=UPI001359E5A9|nr:SDR family NAD(P)-dependent oxidoreductase [Chryseobacterium sp. c4a]